MYYNDNFVVLNFSDIGVTIEIYKEIKIYSFNDLSDQKKLQITEMMKVKKRLFGFMD